MLRFGKTMQRSCWVFGGFLIACDLIRPSLPFDFNPLIPLPFCVPFCIRCYFSLASTACLFLRYDGEDAGSTSVTVRPGTPIKMINMTCPPSAVSNSTVSCPFAPVDALGNMATPDMLPQVQTLVASTSNGAPSTSSSPVDLVVTHNGQAFVLGCRSEATGTVVVSFFVFSFFCFFVFFCLFCPIYRPID